jgi:signal peptidase complex subunit 3
MPMPLHDIKASISNPTVHKFGHASRTRFISESYEQAILSFDVDMDLSALWRRWNTKQVYVWIAATHTTSKHQHNEIILYDRIFQSPEESVFKRKRVRAEYSIIDMQRELKTSTLHLTVRWDIMPVVGVLQTGGGYDYYNVTMKLPDKYVI